MPAVSVITPFYNRARWVRSVFDTLKRQTFTDFELIVVDDGSEDDLPGAIDDCQSPFPVRVVRLGSNTGAAAARNIGIDHAKGRYVTFLDSDDGWADEKLRRQYDHIEQASDRNQLVSLTRHLVVGRHLYVAPRRLLTRDDSVGAYLFQLNGIIQSSMLFMSADLARSVRFSDSSRGHDDWSFALRLERAGARFEMLPEPLTIYNDQSGRPRRSPEYSNARFQWLDDWREHLGDGPYLAGRALVASNMRKPRKLQHLRDIATASAGGAIPLWRAAYYSAAWAFPFVRSVGTHVKQTRLGRSPRVTRRASPNPEPRSEPGARSALPN